MYTAAAVWGSGRKDGHGHDFPLSLLALGEVLLLVTLLAKHQALLVVVSTVPLCFHNSNLGTLA